MSTNLRSFPHGDVLIDNLPDTNFIVDGKGRILRIDGDFLNMFGYQQAELLGQSMELLIPERSRAKHDNHFRSYQTAPRTRSMNSASDCNMFALRKDGTEFPIDIMLSPITTESQTLVVVVLRDITNQFKTKEKLKKLAYRDQLTGLPNWICLLEDLDSHFDQNDSTSLQPMSLVIMKLDGLDDVNISLGHVNGDHLINEIAERMLNVSRRNAQLYRTGGCEFTVLISDCGDPLIVGEMVDRLLDQLAVPFDVENNRVHMQAHGGLAISPTHGSDSESLVSNARLALNSVSKNGLQRFCIYNPALRARAKAQRELEAGLRRAFSNNDFELFFQPQVCLSSGKVLGAEALLRWRHSERGIISPTTFIDTLAVSPIAYDLGNWILRSACEKAAAWRVAGLPPIRIGVNLFSAQFVGGTLVRDVENTLAETGLPAEFLELEITENTALSRDDSIVESLQVLRDKGVSIAFDDFGTGYASLSYLSNYPLSRIKIDRSFMQDIPANSEQTAITRALITMAHSLDLLVTAEGVETPDQVSFLRSKGCEEAQGFLYAKPMPDHEFIEHINNYGAATPLKYATEV